MYLEHLICYFTRCCGIAEPPTGHGICLGKAAGNDCALAHSGQRRYRHMFPAVCKLRIYLVRENKYIGAAQHLCDSLELFSGHDSAGGVVRIWEHEHLCARGNSRTELLGSYLEAVLFLCFEKNRSAARQGNDRSVADKARHGNDDLISVVDTGTDSKIDSLAAADGDEYLVVCIVVQIEAAGEITRYLMAKLSGTAVGGIIGLSLLEAVDSSLTYMPRSDEIRLTYGQRDNVLHLAENIEKLSYSRRLK